MNTLVIMAKHPVAGQVKTRLAKSVGDTTAAELATAFLVDLVARLRTCGHRRVLATWPPGEAAEAFFTDLAGDHFELWTQPPGTLGDRLAGVATNFLDHDDRIVVIGSDSPTLPAKTIETAFEALDTADVVLVPSDDGGYVLVGQRREVPELFDRIDWSTSRVFEQTRQRLKAAGTSFVELSGWYDIDTREDLSRLDRELAIAREREADGAGERLAPATSRRLDAMPADWDSRPQDR
ncbi:MAG TPA: glycosyltransferase [Planctomycetaceae bacterium]|nr:glycosyltransferase [Planctomycetaceae bacterium]|tara:strand:+ start:17587 stop:18297 length:711 start_codon:yes stop_codon:yes gene_type:complete